VHNLVHVFERPISEHKGAQTVNWNFESFGKLAVRHSELFSPSDDFQNVILIERQS